MQVARQLVIYKKRPGGQSQFRESLAIQTLTSTGFENLHIWVSKNLGDERLHVDLLAEHVGMSSRNFARSYKAKPSALRPKQSNCSGWKPHGAPAGRNRARRRPHRPQLRFSDEERMRTTFQNHLAISPRGYRRRFSTRMLGD